VYAARKAVMTEHIDVVRRLWAGEEITRIDGGGEKVAVRIYPSPVQPSLPFWITSSGRPDTFRLAGELGGNLLTHLLGQRPDVLRRNIALYREALAARHGSAARGRVTLMLHTLLGPSDAEVLEIIREPFGSYLASSLDLTSRSGPTTEGMDELTEADRESLLRRAFDRYSRDSGLFGSPDTARRTLAGLASIGVDEVACLIDFGVEHAVVRRGLDLLADLARDNA
jgi:natural product biosynthesis luciferase-like monooxygenase protein